MTNTRQKDGTMTQVGDLMSSSSSIPKDSQETQLTLESVKELLGVTELPEGLMTPEGIVWATQKLVNRLGIESVRRDRKLHLAQLEQLQTF